MPMIIGKISENEKKVKFNVEIHCTNCGKKVPGGLKAEEKYSQTEAFKIELENFKRNYLCGICRDKKRLNVKIASRGSIVEFCFQLSAKPKETAITDARRNFTRITRNQTESIKKSVSFSV